MHRRNAQYQTADISARHFPDTSDEMSFQIPSFRDHEFDAPACGEGCRLGDVELDFDAFGDGAFLDSIDMDGSDPLATPIAKSIPLTISQLTPRREELGRACQRDAVAVAVASSSMGEEGGGMAEEMEKQQKETQKRQLSVRPQLLPKKEPIDDMFERRKRDNYQQMGLDLSSRSTARFRQHKGDDKDMDKENVMDYGQAPASTSDNNSISAPEPMAAGKPPEEHPRKHPKKDKGTAKILPKRSTLDKKTVLVPKHKPRTASSAAQPKSILKSSKPVAALQPSTLPRSHATPSHMPQAERPSWGDVVAEVQHARQRRESGGSVIAALGGGLVDVLVMYGEKLKGSLGFSSANKAATPQASIRTHNHSSLYNGSEKAQASGSSSKPLTLSDLSPSKSEEHQRNFTLSEMTPSEQHQDTDMESDAGQEQRQAMSPMRPSKKRSSSGTSSEHSKTRLKQDGEMERAREEGTSFQSLSKHSKTVRDKGVANKVISRPRPLGPSRTLNKFPGSTRPRPGSQLSDGFRDGDPKSLATTTLSARDERSKVRGKSVVTVDLRRAAQDKEQNRPPSLTVPSAPAFAGDVHRQRALEKKEKERKQREQREIEKRDFKAGRMPYFSKPAPPARPAVRPTIPVAFTFHSDARVAQRNVEFEEKRKTWEVRSTTRRQVLPMPDFTALHAAQAQAVQNSRRGVVPVLPTDALALTTMVRAKEREKFEVERRERERAVERQREMRERERAEIEEKEYREARKRTVPKAHEVPEWYKNLPWRKEGG